MYVYMYIHTSLAYHKSLRKEKFPWDSIWIQNKTTFAHKILYYSNTNCV